VDRNGEEQAIAYWESRKEGYMQHYQQNLAKVDTELNSTLLNNLTDKWKDQAREVAKQDPIKVLDLINELKDKELERQEISRVELKASQEQQAKREHIEGIHLQFKEIQKTLKEYPTAYSAFKDHLKELACEMTRDKTFMEALKLSDAKEAKLIEHIAQDKKLQEQERTQEHIRSLDRGRGGLSL